MVDLVPLSIERHVGLLWEWLLENPSANFDDGGPSTFDGFRQYIASQLENRHVIIWCITVDDVPVGAISAKVDDLDPGVAMFRGLCVTESMHRRGVATEAVRLMLLKLGKCRQHAIVAYVFADNVAVMKFFERIGGYASPCGLVTRRDGQDVPLTKWLVTIGGG